MSRAIAVAALALLCISTDARAQVAAIPYNESFESPGWPGPEWTRTYSNPTFGRILPVAPSPISPDGGLAANFDVSASVNLSTNELTLSVDLAAAPGAVLRYWAKETGDETDPQDGLFLNDGVSASWPKVVDHGTLTGSWVEISVDLWTAAAANGLGATSNFKIRFSQRDNYPSPTDGLQIDGVRITAPVMGPGQSNSAAAGLDVNGQPGIVGLNGPFVTTASPGALITFEVQGAAGQPYVLLAGPLNPNNAVFPGIGSLDLGVLGPVNVSDVVILLDGTQPGFLNSLARTDPLGRSTLVFSMPPAASGPWFTFQAAVFNGPGILLTAATSVTVP
jgi:hypothetical protein